uniref:G protein-coupled receptor n=1 Tax=Steinernema glaseri TaxID=37863 RepID=A0A1I7Y537_9BILA
MELHENKRRGVAVAEFIFLIILWASTILLFCLIFRSRSIKEFWRKSSTLAIVFAFIFLNAVHQIIHFTSWTLYVSQASPSQIFGNAEPVFGITSISIQSFYDCFTIVLFVQRIAIIMDPAKNRRTYNRILYGAATIACCSIFLWFIVAYSKVIDFSVNMVPAECYTLTCTNPFRVERSALNARTALSITNVVVGIVFLVVFLSRKTIMRTNVAKVNQLTRVLFFERLFLEVIPLTVDSIFIAQTGVSIGLYIGPFGAIGCTTEAFCFVLVYYIVFKPPRKAGPGHSSTQ